MRLYTYLYTHTITRTGNRVSVPASWVRNLPGLARDKDIRQAIVVVVSHGATTYDPADCAKLPLQLQGWLYFAVALSETGKIKVALAVRTDGEFVPISSPWTQQGSLWCE